ncbi:hypothetical protein PIROE2DRAFT_16638 [Piromyces sp. E2]|nr:hypothetical protein PIROE2DRAFT_16638 [Piromyces sp. E2]|eukprot:OUM58159.1 hypothetical protein PIROE2DRAFT_16638 [Piromyces sp. E2]
MPRGRPRQNPVTEIANTDSIPKTINFNYSENFNRVIELSIDNYTEWKTNILYLLCINNLETYVSSEKVKKIRKRDISDNINNYIQDKFDDSLVYDKITTEEDIKNDITVKDKINDMKYSINEDIHIFMSTLQNYIDYLENIEGDLSDNSKVGILNRGIPEDLRWINVLQFKDDWEKCV